MYFCLPNAKVAQLVEHDLAKVGVAGSNPVFRSSSASDYEALFLFYGDSVLWFLTSTVFIRGKSIMIVY